jgi:hypothetical protein
MPPLQKLFCNSTPDEPGSAGDKNLFWQCVPRQA